MANTLRSALTRAFRRQNRRVTLRPGRIETFPFTSAIFGNTREVTVYLPASYDERGSQQSYPVLYMHDGQNLFDPMRSFIPGQHWRLREAADLVIGTRKARPMIIVGLDNMGAQRIDEYTPTHDSKRDAGGRADEYARMLLDEVRPIIAAKYRTQSGRENTAVGGSSLGGLLTLHLALAHPEEFGAAAAMSPSVWWDNREILEEVERFEGPRPRIWLDIGGREGIEALRDARKLRDRLRASGWTDDEDLHYHEDRRADHSERAWAARVTQVLEFLFPA